MSKTEKDCSRKVSIIIPVFNGANYMQQAIDSALAQTYTNLEILVVNDGSKDGGKTEEIALSYGNRIRYLAKENGGVASALNHGIKNMTGEYLSWLSHDDAYYANKIEHQVRFSRELEDKHVVLYSDFELVDSESSSLGFCRLDHSITMHPLRAILSASIHGCSTLVPKAVLERVGFFNEDLKTTQDNDMWLRIYQSGINFVHVPEVLIQSRVHSEQGQLRLRSINRSESIKFYSLAFQQSSKAITRDGKGLLQVLARKRINLPISVLRGGMKEGTEKLPWKYIMAYKGRVYLEKARSKLGFHIA